MGCVAPLFMFIVATLLVPQPSVKFCGLVTEKVGKPEDEVIVKVLQVEQPLEVFTRQCVYVPGPPGKKVVVGVLAVKVPPKGEIH